MKFLFNLSRRVGRTHHIGQSAWRRAFTVRLKNFSCYQHICKMQNLGKKWFAFSKMDVESFDILGGLHQKRYPINSYGLDNKTVV